MLGEKVLEHPLGVSDVVVAGYDMGIGIFGDGMDELVEGPPFRWSFENMDSWVLGFEGFKTVEVSIGEVVLDVYYERVEGEGLIEDVRESFLEFDYSRRVCRKGDHYGWI